MIDLVPPVIPDGGDRIDNSPPDTTPDSFAPVPAVRNFSFVWYRFFDKVQKFLAEVRSAPRQVAQTDLAALAVKLARTQPGVVVWVPVFNHLLRWSGTVWTFAPGDGGSGYTAAFLDPPTADGWKLCDASDATFLRADGTLGTVTLPNTAGLYFRR